MEIQNFRHNPCKVIKFIAIFAKIDAQMNVEREIAGFALPFAAGVLIAAYTGTIFYGNSAPINIFAFSAVILSTVLLMQRNIFHLEDWIIWLLIGTGALGCGLLSGFNALHPFRIPDSGLDFSAAYVNENLQSAINSIPFRNEDSKALIKALLTGERSSLSSEIKEAFRTSGASHILALSGLHLGIIYGLLAKSLSIFGNSQIMKVLRSTAIICICGLYTMATGANDSLVRAFIFIVLGETARLTGRYNGLGQIMLASMIIQLIIFPQAIRAVGFQLSYAAIAGIAFIFPWLKGFWDRAETLFRTNGDETNNDKKTGSLMISRPMRWIWNSAALSISCQITTGPLAYIYFGTFPMHFMLTNILALPLTGILIPAALVTLSLSCLGCCPYIILEATEFLITILIKSLDISASM